jgi:hypothetical protein
VALGPVWTGVERVESLAPTGIQTANHATHSVSLYRTRYPDFYLLSCRIPFAVEASCCGVTSIILPIQCFFTPGEQGKL